MTLRDRKTILKMPKPLSVVAGLIEIDAASGPQALAPRPRRPGGPAADRLCGDRQSPNELGPTVLRLRAPTTERLRANLERLCRELDAELARVKQQLKRLRDGISAQIS